MDDEDLLRQFEDRTLPFDHWTHRSHVKVAYLYLRRFPFPAALDRIRRGIKAYNAAHNVPEGQTRGYNETTPCPFPPPAAATIRPYDGASPAENAAPFCAPPPQLMPRHVLRLFYSPERRMDPR